MTKNGNGTTGKILLAITITVFAVSIAAIVWDASHKSSSIDNNRKDIDIIVPKVETNKEACQEFRYKIDTLATKMTELSTEQKALRTDQNAAFGEILSRLPDK